MNVFFIDFGEFKLAIVRVRASSNKVLKDSLPIGRNIQKSMNFIIEHIFQDFLSLQLANRSDADEDLIFFLAKSIMGNILYNCINLLTKTIMKSLIIFLIAMCNFTCFAQFKNIKWGMSMKQVIQLDSIKNPIREGNSLIIKYSDELLATEKIYNFDKDKLVSIAFITNKSKKESNTEKYALSEFEAISHAFIASEYGKPYKAHFEGPVYRVWKTSTHKLLVEIVYDKQIGFAVKTEYFSPESKLEGIDY